MMQTLDAMGAALVQWLGVGLVDGTLFALLVWLVNVTLLRRTSARLVVCTWLLALAGFVVTRPVTLHRLPLSAAGARELAPAAGLFALPWVYLGVVGLLALRAFVGQRRLRRHVSRLPRAAADVQSAVSRCARSLSLTRVPDVRVTDQASLPFSLGPLRPTVVLPRFACAPGPQLDAVLLHELAHLARRDHWLLFFERTVTTLFFFWPPVHWAARRLADTRELACDEHALACSTLPAHAYGQQLLNVVQTARGRAASAGALAIGPRGPRLERRIDSLLSQRWSQPLHVLEALALTALLCASLVSLRAQHRPPPRPSPAVDTFACDGSAMSQPPQP